MGKILENIKKRRQAILAEKKVEAKVARKAFRKAKFSAITEREKRRAKAKYGKTTGEKIQDVVSGLGAMGAQPTPKPRPRAKGKKQGAKKKRKGKAALSFDLGGFDDLGDLDNVFDDDIF